MTEKKRTIFDIRADIESLLDGATDQETGELVGFDEDAFNALQIEESEKIQNLLLYIKNLDAFVDGCKAEEKKIADKRKTAEKKAERLKDFAAMLLHGEKFTTPSVSVTYRKSETVSVTDSKKLFWWARRHSMTNSIYRKKDPEVDKTELKRMLKSGKVVPGVSIEEKTNMQIK